MREVRAAQKWKMVADWEGLIVGGGGGNNEDGVRRWKILEGSGDFGIRGGWTESREDEGRRWRALAQARGSEVVKGGGMAANAFERTRRGRGKKGGEEGGGRLGATWG
jgi:hypothetical protein